MPVLQWEAFAVGALACLSAWQLAAQAPSPVGERMVYKQVDGHDLALYIDAAAPSATAHSAIVFFHGGAWTMGEVSQFNKQAAYLAGRGMMAIQVEYRLLNKAGNEPPRICVEDAKTAMRWVRSHAVQLHLDPARIVAAGGSAGGYLAAVATMVPGWDAPTDDLSISPRGNAMVLFNPVIDGGPDGFGYKRFGDSYRQTSPMYHVTAEMPPTLIQSGDADKLVSPASLRLFQQEAQKAGARCELVFYPGQPHSFFTPEPYTTQSLAVAAQFLESLHLLLPGPLPVNPPAGDSAGQTEPVASPKQGATTVVDIDATAALPLPSRAHFAGANMQLLLTGTSYRDAAFQRAVAGLAPGWLRFPGGTVDDVYDWKTGTLPAASIAKFEGTKGVAHSEMVRDAAILAGKGPVTLADYAAFLQSQPQRPSTIGVINTFTDTPAAATELVAQTQRSGVHVDVWELGNEPFYFPSFYADATAYLGAVEPFAAAVRKADPGAKVAVYLQRNDAWLDQLARYPNRFWDELYWHPYPTLANVTPAEQLAYYNDFLGVFLNGYLDGTLVSKFGPDYKLEVSEYNIGALRGGVFGAVFVAELALRLSSNPHITHVGMHILTGTEQTLDAAILPKHDHIEQAVAAGAAGHPVDLHDADFGYYASPYGLALQLIDAAINNSTAVLATRLSRGSSVTANSGTHAAATVPAVYAQAYAHGPHETVLLLTNKSADSQRVEVRVNGASVAGDSSLVVMGDTDPLARNTATAPLRVALRTATVRGDITIPAFGVAAVHLQK